MTVSFNGVISNVQCEPIDCVAYGLQLQVSKCWMHWWSWNSRISLSRPVLPWLSRAQPKLEVHCRSSDSMGKHRSQVVHSWAFQPLSSSVLQWSLMHLLRQQTRTPTECNEHSVLELVVCEVVLTRAMILKESSSLPCQNFTMATVGFAILKAMALSCHCLKFAVLEVPTVTMTLRAVMLKKIYKCGVLYSCCVGLYPNICGWMFDHRHSSCTSYSDKGSYSFCVSVCIMIVVSK